MTDIPVCSCYEEAGVIFPASSPGINDMPVMQIYSIIHAQ